MNSVTENAPGAPTKSHIIEPEKVQRALHALPSERVLNGLSETFKVLSNTNRLKIIHALSLDEICVGDLAALLGSTDSAVSHQLRLLRSMRLVKYRRDGKLTYYSLDDQHVYELFQAGLEHLQET